MSYAHGGVGPPLVGITVGGVLDDAASRWPDRDALVVTDQDVRWSWKELRERARALATGLLATGLNPGDRIGMLAPNRAEWLVAQFGSAYAGLILVNINPAYRQSELEYALNKVGCRGLITETRFKSSDYIGMLQSLAPELATASCGDLHAERLPALRTVIHLGSENIPGMFSLEQVSGRLDEESLQRLEAIAQQLDFDAPVNIQFTSGTTGAPKAATLTHHNMINNTRMSAAILKFTEKDRLCIPVPMYHCFGMVLGTLLCATTGAAIVFPGAAFEAESTLQAIEAEACTALHGVPTMFIAMLDDPGFEQYDLSSLRTGIMAGAPCPVELMREVIDDMHMSEITIGYGMTETGPLSTQTMPDDPIELRVGTVGRTLANTEIKIVDEDGLIVALDQPGELCVRGYNVMLGYWDDGKQDSWMHTGDIATMDEAGYVRIVGRSKDMLIRGGENVYPREIEDFLYTNPKVDQVEVVGVPDTKFGEEIAACIKLGEGQRATVEEIQEFCRGQLSYFKIPRYVFFVEEFPMTVTGKVQKFILREQLAEELRQKSGTS
ncbi:MAG: AMP-binding protein [Woeseiaceae bacterium]|nr:AMP-binding protein [Woeseiaceae bacterium]MDX2609017.1 AMP-binding protein [Woeseiaceae bacterium]